MLLITDVLDECVQQGTVKLRRASTWGNSISIDFVLRGSDGTRMAGGRTFDLGDKFADMADFVDELWSGDLFDVPPIPVAETKLSLLWTAVPLVIGTASSVVVATAGGHVTAAAAPMFVVLVLTAIVMGWRHALVLTGLQAVAMNLFIIEPVLRFSEPLAAEWMVYIGWLVSSLLIPLAVRYREGLRRDMANAQEQFLSASGMRVEI
ncbi:hypothetical protein [Bradyrhizobium sp. SZCCHNRI2049]|uniref:hypothetical protein n=1 Tax=Bradyrhizobium sp. SZCCHNRI2049 TaxID=3057287 RepID=UPI00291683E3|nr:hypothetical protein [Bradyrhizobium sp. SZCCHNRI2049]